MKNYVKVVLYAYPMLKTIGREYQIHISNRAVLSYKSMAPAQELAEYIAGEIICKQRLEWLKNVLDGIWERLDDTEKTLLAVRYFGGVKKRKALAEKKNVAPCAADIAVWTESKYFRRQQRLAKKVEAMLLAASVTEELFESVYAPLDIFAPVIRFVEKGKEQGIVKRERRWLEKK